MEKHPLNNVFTITSTLGNTIIIIIAMRIWMMMIMMMAKAVVVWHQGVSSVSMLKAAKYCIWKKQQNERKITTHRPRTIHNHRRHNRHSHSRCHRHYHHNIACRPLQHGLACTKRRVSVVVQSIVHIYTRSTSRTHKIRYNFSGSRKGNIPNIF